MRLHAYHLILYFSFPFLSVSFFSFFFFILESTLSIVAQQSKNEASNENWNEVNNKIQKVIEVIEKYTRRGEHTRVHTNVLARLTD